MSKFQALIIIKSPLSTGVEMNVGFCFFHYNLCVKRAFFKFIYIKSQTAAVHSFFSRKLHCMRNYIHMNLMISFILRYTTVLIKDRVVKDHYDPARFEQLSPEEMKLFCDDFGGVSAYMVRYFVIE